MSNEIQGQCKVYMFSLYTYSKTRRWINVMILATLFSLLNWKIGNCYSQYNGTYNTSQCYEEIVGIMKLKLHIRYMFSFYIFLHSQIIYLPKHSNPTISIAFQYFFWTFMSKTNLAYTYMYNLMVWWGTAFSCYIG